MEIRLVHQQLIEKTLHSLANSIRANVRTKLHKTRQIVRRVFIEIPGGIHRAHTFLGS